MLPNKTAVKSPGNILGGEGGYKNRKKYYYPDQMYFSYINDNLVQ